MPMRRIICAAALALVAGCGGQESGDEAAVNQAIEGQPPATVPSAISAAEGETVSREQEQAAEEFSWTGRFAANRELCTGGVWDIAEDRIVTDGETSCDVDSVGRAPRQVTLRLVCTAEGMNSDETWTLTPRELEGITVARSTGQGPVDLIRCE